VLAPGEVVVMFVDGRRFGTISAGRGGQLNLDAQSARWARLERAERGDVETPTETVRYLAVPVRPRGAFVVAASLSAERANVNEAVRLAALVLLSVLLIASALAWAVAGRVLAPLRVLDETARSISATDLTRRIPVSGDDEIAELARTFNAMVERLERAFASQRAFVSDASHELRTPITIVRGHLELLGDDPAERRETIALVMDELDRMSRFVDDLLLLAKAERHDFLHVEEVELGALTDELLEKATGLGPRSWSLEARGEARLRGDRQRLTQAVMGLAQNAVQHSAAGDPVWIGTGIDGDEAALWVRDSGPGISREDQGRVFERFARASGSRRRSEGAGLGLAIVRAIAEAHGGRVELASRPGAGSTFTVIVPLEGPR
jgi:two-component system OmpR family sensor kinase